jgi:ATP/maltotriose-dependent transcriptional regulator MalT
VVIQAPAGCGKTAVALQFLLDEDVDPHWYTCSPDDAAPAALLAGLVRALDGGETPGGQTALAAIGSRDVAQSYPAALKPFLQEMETRAAGAVLVIDDADPLIGAPIALEVLDYALSALSLQIRIVLISRAEVPLPSQAKRLLDGRAARVTADDLLLREDEVGEFAQHAYGMTLSEREVARLFRITGGWAIALRLALRLKELDALPDDTQGGPSLSAEARSDLFAYLTTEVLSRVDDRIAQFLRRTAVLDTLDPRVCARLTGEERSVDLIQSLASAGLPVIKAGWSRYRCHNLLREYLLDSLSDQELREAHSAAALAYAQIGEWPLVLEHFAAAGDQRAMLSVADVHGRELFYGGQGRRLLDFIKPVPIEYLDEHPAAEYWAAFAAARLFQLDWAANAFERAHKNATAQGAAALAADALRALAHLLNGWGRYPAAAAVSQQLLDSVPPSEVASRAAVTLGYVITSMGATSQFREAVANTRELLPALSTEPRADAVAEAYARSVAGATLAMEGDFAAARAEINVARVLILGREDDDIHTFVPWMSALVEFNSAEPDRADDAALAAETLALQYGDLQRVLECRALRASTATMRGNVDEADRAFAQLDELRAGGADYWGLVLTLLSRPERLRLRGDLPAALAAAEANHALSVTLGGGRFVCSTRLDVAYYRLLTGDAGAARDHAHAALEEARALDAALLVYGAQLLIAATTPEEEESAMAEALRLADERDFRFLMPYVIRLPQLDAALWRAMGTSGATRTAVLLASSGPQTAKTFTAVAGTLSEEAALRSILVLQTFGSEGRAALRVLTSSSSLRVAKAARDALSSLDARNPHRLSEREQEVLAMLSEGLRTKDIAERLVLTPATVSTHIQRIMSKTGTASRAELLALAAREAKLPVN